MFRMFWMYRMSGCRLDMQDADRMCRMYRRMRRMSRMKQISTLLCCNGTASGAIEAEAFSFDGSPVTQARGAKTIVLAHKSGCDALAGKVASAYALPGAQTVPSARREAKSEIRHDVIWQGARALAPSCRGQGASARTRRLQDNTR